MQLKSEIEGRNKPYPECTCSVPSPGFLRPEVLLTGEGTEQVRLRYGWTTILLEWILSSQLYILYTVILLIFLPFFIHYVIHLMIVKWLFHEHKDAVFWILLTGVWSETALPAQWILFFLETVICLRWIYGLFAPNRWCICPKLMIFYIKTNDVICKRATPFALKGVAILLKGWRLPGKRV